MNPPGWAESFIRMQCIALIAACAASQTGYNDSGAVVSSRKTFGNNYIRTLRPSLSRDRTCKAGHWQPQSFSVKRRHYGMSQNRSIPRPHQRPERCRAAATTMQQATLAAGPDRVSLDDVNDGNRRCHCRTRPMRIGPYTNVSYSSCPLPSVRIGRTALAPTTYLTTTTFPRPHRYSPNYADRQIILPILNLVPIMRVPGRRVAERDGCRESFKVIGRQERFAVRRAPCRLECPRSFRAQGGAVCLQ